MKQRTVAALAALTFAFAVAALLPACGAPSLAPIHAAGYRALTETGDGWVAIGAPGGALRFMVPGVPEVRRRHQGAASVTVFDLRTEANSRGFLVHVFDFGAEPPPRSEALDLMEARLRAWIRGSFVRVGDAARGGLPERDLEVREVTRHGHVAQVRLTDGGRYGVAMTMISPLGGGDVGADLQRFRASLRFASRQPAPGFDPDLD